MSRNYKYLLKIVNCKAWVKFDREVEKEEMRDRPKSNKVAIVDHAMWVKVSVGDEEADDNVDEKRNLAGDVEDEEVLWKTPKETKF